MALDLGFGLGNGLQLLEAIEGLDTELAAPKFFGETEWHREWKNAFPQALRERTFLNKTENYYHRADVFTACGTAIEFQNSSITLAELQSREAFYPNLIWVVNGAKFKGFKVLKALPFLNDPKLAEFEFSQGSNLTLIRKADLELGVANPRPLTFHHPELRGINFSTCYYSFRWSNPHRVWYQATCPIVIDLGGYFLYRLCQRQQISGAYAYLHMIPRKDFLSNFIV